MAHDPEKLASTETRSKRYVIFVQAGDAQMAAEQVAASLIEPELTTSFHCLHELSVSSSYLLGHPMNLMSSLSSQSKKSNAWRLSLMFSCQLFKKMMNS